MNYGPEISTLPGRKASMAEAEYEYMRYMAVWYWETTHCLDLWLKDENDTVESYS